MVVTGKYSHAVQLTFNIYISAVSGWIGKNSEVGEKKEGVKREEERQKKDKEQEVLLTHPLC